MRLLVAWAVCGGCGAVTAPVGHTGSTVAHTAPTGPEETETETETEPTGEGTVLAASCASTSNDLRILCSVTTSEEASVAFWFEAADGAPWTWPSTRGTVHDRVLWGLPAGATVPVYATVDGVDVLVDTWVVPVPDLLSSINLNLVRTASAATEQVAFPQLCGSDNDLHVLDPNGTLIWYEDLGAYGRNNNGLDFTPQGTFLVLMDTSQLIEIGLDGTVLKHWTSDELGVAVHHEVRRVGDSTFVGTAESEVLAGDPWVLSGVREYDDDQNLLWSWNVGDVMSLPAAFPWSGAAGYWASDFPGAYDPMHLNAFSIDDEGDVYVSFQLISTIFKVEHSPGAALPGDLLWSMSPSFGYPQTLGLTPSMVDPAFRGQHHVVGTPSRITMFDNSAGVDARALVIDVDDDLRTFAAADEFPTALSCEVTGSAYDLGTTFLMECGPAARAVEVDTAGEIVWELDHSCRTGSVTVYRLMPVDLSPREAYDR